MTNWQVPFVRSNMVHYVDPWQESQPGFEWKDPYEFDDELEYESMDKGRSRVTITLKSLIDGRTYQTTLKGFLTMCTNGQILQTEKSFSIKGRFGFTKQGTTIATYIHGRNR